MINWGRCLETLHWLLSFVARLLEGGVHVMFDIAVSVLFIIALVELIKYLKRH